MSRSRAFASALALFASSFVTSIAAPARAQAHRFEPTDLDLQPEGRLEIDSQSGFVQGDSAARLVLPDLEVSFGVAPGVNLEVDTAYGIEGRPGARLTLDHPAPDNLWLSSKIGFVDWHDAPDRAWALGAQFGPKLPIARGARGAGWESLLLIGRNVRKMHLVLNAGAFVDPGPDQRKVRSVAFEGGLDLNLDLDTTSTWSFLGEVAFIAFASPDPHELHATGGLQYSVSPSLDLSVVGLVGFLNGGDQAGVLLGVTPRFAFWK